MTKEEKRINKQKRKAEFDEINHQRVLKYKKLKDTKISEKQKYKKKKKKIKADYKNQCKQAKKDQAIEFKTQKTNLKNKYKAEHKKCWFTTEYKKEIKQIKNDNHIKFNNKLLELKNAYEENLFSAKVSMLYEISKNQMTEKQQKYEKMRVDKKCAYRIYHKKMNFIANIYHQKVNEINKDYQTKKNAYSKDLQVFISQNKNNKNTAEYKRKIEELHNQYVKINLDYQSKIIENRIIYKNTCAQALHERDLSYDNDLDKSFKLRRWWYGMGKEFQRMSWPSAKKTFKDFWIVIIVCLILAGIFTLLDYILTLI